LLANPLKPRAPYILSKVAVDKLRLKFNQVKNNPNSLVLHKANHVKKLVPMANSAGEDKTRTSQNNNNNNNTPSQLKALVPAKAMPIASEELPTNNNMSLIKSKPVAMKAVPLPSQDMPTPNTKFAAEFVVARPTRTAGRPRLPDCSTGGSPNSNLYF